MTDLPRSRALVRLDGPGHIMPVEPITPPGSTLWRVVHLPVVLGLVAAGLLAIAVLGMRVLGLGFSLVDYVPGARYLAPMIGAAAAIGVYWVFVRVVERRPVVDELGGNRWAGEFGAGLAIGLALSVATAAAMWLAGDLRVLAVASPRTLVLPFVDQLCTAIVLEILLNGILFRLVERTLGTWLTLIVAAAAFAAVPFLGARVTPAGIVAVMLEVGLACAASYVLTRRLWTAIGLYAAWNFGQVGIFGFAGVVGGSPSYLLVEVVGPAWLTGGDAGADVSMPALLLNALLVATLLAIAVQRGRIVRPAWQRGRIA